MHRKLLHLNLQSYIRAFIVLSARFIPWKTHFRAGEKKKSNGRVSIFYLSSRRTRSSIESQSAITRLRLSRNGTATDGMWKNRTCPSLPVEIGVSWNVKETYSTRPVDSLVENFSRVRVHYETEKKSCSRRWQMTYSALVYSALFR